MKNFKTLFGMMAVALMAASCTNDVSDVLAPEAPQQGIPFVATLAPKTFSATTRTLLTENTDGTISSTWVEGDKITLSYGDFFSPTTATATVEEVKDDGSATIVATLGSGITDGQEVSLFYSTSEGTSQYGQLSNKLDSRFGKGKFTVTDGVASLDGSVKMEAAGSIFKFTLLDLNGDELKVSKFTISTAQFGEYGDIAIASLNSAASELYIGIDGDFSPKKDTEVWFTATDAAGNPYIAKVITTKDVEAGYYYQSTLKMATLGDLMNSDGSFSAKVETGKTPIGVIAYLGKDATVESIADGGGHGLVLALKNAASGVAWSTNTETWEFGEEAAVDDLDALKRTTDVSGYTNTKTLMDRYTNGVNDCPAAFWSVEYSKDVSAPTGTTGWFLPSAQQWVKMMTGLGGLSGDDIAWGSWFDNDHTAADNWEAALEKAGDGNYDSMTSWLWYWSSSEYSQNYAVNVEIRTSSTGNGYGFSVQYGSKASASSVVRSVLAF